MRSVLLCALLLSMAGCDGQVAPPAGWSDVPQREIDLGELAVVPEGHDFTVAVRNVGGAPVRVTRIELSCGCSSAGDFNPLIEAGETVEVPLHVNPKGAGPGGTAVTVTTDEQPPRVHRVDVVWTGVAAVEPVPLNVDFGDVRPGTDEVRTVAVRRRDPQTIVSNWVATPTGRIAVEPGDDTATIRIHAGDEFGEFSGTVTAEVKGAWPPMLRIPVRWTVRDVFDVSPRRLFFGTLTSGETVERQIVVMADKEGSIQHVQFGSKGSAI